MSTRRGVVAVLAALLLFAGCRGCRQPAAAPVLTLVTSDARLALYVPRIGTLSQNAAAFVTALESRAHSDAIRRVRLALATQLGVDPLAPDALGRLGLRADGEALLYVAANERWPLLLLPLEAPETFERAIRALVQKVDGADRFATEEIGATRVHVIGRPFGDAVVPVLGYLARDGYVFVATGPGIAQLHAMARQSTPADARPQSLGAVWHPRPSAGVVPWAALYTPHGSATMTLGASGLDIDGFVKLADAQGVALLAGSSPVSLLPEVGSDALLFALTPVARADVWTALHALPSAAAVGSRLLGQFANASGLDPEREVLPLLAGPLSAAVYLGDPQVVGSMLQRARPARLSLDVVHVAIVARLRDPTAMLTLLRRSQKLLAERHIAVREIRESFGGQEAQLFVPGDPARAKLGWAVWGDRYVYGAGSGRLRATLDRLARLRAGSTDEQGPHVDDNVLRDWLAHEGTSMVVVRGTALGERLGNLLGGAAATEPTLGTALDAVIRLVTALGDVGVAVQAEPEGLRLRVHEALP
ncbi:MAG: hypothetical protein AAB426_07130 [Myxococcota bacterium]